jgi:hypothetical protein
VEFSAVIAHIGIYESHDSEAGGVATFGASNVFEAVCVDCHIEIP